MKILGYTLFERIQEAKTPLAKIVKTEFGRERPAQVTFERLVLYHDQTPQVRVAVSSYAELITGTELIVSAENDEAKEIIDEWIRQTDFYRKFEGLVATILICGNAILERLDSSQTDDVEEVDMTTIMSKKRTDVGVLEYYEQRQQSGKIVKLGEDNLDRFIEFNLTNYSKQAWGRSLFYPLAVPRIIGNRTTAPMVEVMWGMEDAFAGIIQNNAYPITTITYPGANDEYLEKEAERWRRYKPGDKRVQKIKPEIEFWETAAQSKYTDYVQHMEKVFELGTQFPHDILTGDFTSRASSETTENIVMKLVRGYQRYLCNKLLTDLFNPILEQHGLNAEEAKLKITFVAQNIVELTPDQVLKLFTDKAITIKELREWYRANTGIDLPDDDALKQAMEDEKQQQQQKFDSQMTDLQNKIEKVTSDKYNDEKIREMAAQLEQKMNSIKESLSNDKEATATRKIKALEKYIRTMESVK